MDLRDGDGVLFTADGFGAYHEPGRCDEVSTEYEDGVPAPAIRAYHRDNLVWLRYVDTGKLRPAIEDVFETYDVSAVAPVHGPPIVGDDVEPYLERLYDDAVGIADGYSVGE